jgi:hypothetical protein
LSPMLGAVLLWISATVLWWSGWKEEAAEGVPHWAVGVFLAVWPVALFWNISAAAALTINGAWIWTMMAFIILAVRMQPNRRWTSISAGVLLGSIYLLLSRLSFYPSLFSHLFAPWAIAIIIGWICAILLRNASEQLLAISSALFLSEGISVIVFSTSESISLDKSSEWMEYWWIAVLYARLWSVSVQTIADQARRWVLRMGWRRG